MTTALSDPTQGDAGGVASVNSNFPNATLFIGDYSGIAATPMGVAALWTDMRLPAPGFPGWGQDAFFALVGPSRSPAGAINQSPGQITINDVTLAEGDSGFTAFVFTVTLSGSSSQPVIVQYATADGTATAGQDYVATSGTLTFAPGKTTETITVQVKGDKTKEGDENFFLNLSGAMNALLADSQGLGTILNDD